MAEYPMPSWLNQQPNYGAVSAARANQQMEAIRMAQAMEMQRRKLDQDAAQFNAQMMLRQQQLKAETDAQLQRLNAQSEIEAHRLQVQSAYNDARINMQQGRLKQGQQKLALDVYKQAQEESNRAEFGREVAAGEQAGKALPEAWREAVYRKGMQLGVPPSAYGAALRNSEREQFTPTATQVDGVDLIQMSPNRFAFKPQQATGPATATDIPGMPGYRQVNLPGQSARVLKLPTFKFDKQKELDELAASSMVSTNYVAPNKTAAKMAKEKRDRFIQLQQERAAAFEDFKRSLNPGSSQIPMPRTLTNAPAVTNYVWDLEKGLLPRK